MKVQDSINDNDKESERNRKNEEQDREDNEKPEGHGKKCERPRRSVNSRLHWQHPKTMLTAIDAATVEAIQVTLGIVIDTGLLTILHLADRMCHAQ